MRVDCTGTRERQANFGPCAQRVHKVLKIKDRRCKKRQRVQKMLKIIQITLKQQEFDVEALGYSPPPPFAKKRLENAEKKEHQR
jgi:hypothetical protein